MRGVHDNIVYGHAADYESGRVVLHTVSPNADVREYTDVVFGGVVACHIEQQAFRGGPGVRENILFDIVDIDPIYALVCYADLLFRMKEGGYSWPAERYAGPDDLAAQLTAGGTKCFLISSSLGLSGFVFARSMEIRSRAARARPAGGDAPELPSPDGGER